MREPRRSLDDFPLHDGEPGEAWGARETPSSVAPAAPTSGAVAPMGHRWSAAAADAAAILAIGALAILGARWVTGSVPRLSGVAWALAFLLFLSFFATVPPLVLFGKTLGMALAELSARSGMAAGISATAAFRRWVGTLGTVAALGMPLLWTARAPESPTPADRFSGHPLTLE
ncbi:MAG: RDD family protein [Acidobacteriota bacterium]